MVGTTGQTAPPDVRAIPASPPPRRRKWSFCIRHALSIVVSRTTGTPALIGDTYNPVDMRVLLVAAGCLLALLLGSSPAIAHGDLHEQIVALTRRLAATPHDATLYLQRGEAYRAHHEPARARADYDRALALNPSLDGARLARARLLVAMGRAAEAGDDLDVFLTRHPRHVTATLTRARARRDLGDLRGAVADYDAVLADRPDPDVGLERARLLAATGLAADRRAAGAGLEHLMTRLGPIVTLDLEVVALLERGGDVDEALAHVERVLVRDPAQVQWLIGKAELLHRAGRLAEARQAYLHASDRLDALPAARRQTRAAHRTRAAIDTALAQLPATLPSPKTP